MTLFLPQFSAASNPILAPRRNLMTKTFGGGTNAIPTFSTSYQGPRTFLAAIPIESSCYAVRLMFTNPMNYVMSVNAAVYPSDTPATVLGDLVDAGANSYAFLPTVNGATNTAGKAIVYFDNNGADVGVLNAAGSSATGTLPANTGNVANAIVPYTPFLSDWIPVTSLARVDGGVQPYIFVYVTVSSVGATFGTNAGYRAYNSNALANRGRKFYFAQATNTGVDYAQNITGTLWKTFSGGSSPNPLYGVQYLSANPGIQIAVNGDSISASPTNDAISSPLYRASLDLSTPSLPVELATFAFGGQSSLIYDPTLKSFLPSIAPSIVCFQPITRNDPGGMSAPQQQAILAKILLQTNAAKVVYGALSMFNQAGLEPFIGALTGAAQTAAIAGFNDILARIRDLSATNSIPFIDAAAVIGDSSNSLPWNYKVGLSDDNTHANWAGAETLTPSAVVALRQLIGL